MALFASLADEVPVERLLPQLAQRGWSAAFPRVAADRVVMHAVGALEQLVSGQRGIREPPESFEEVAPDAVDAWLIPGLAFGRDGSRLGRGAAYYDRLLAEACVEAPRIGVCYAARLLDAVPTEAWDQLVDVVVTDEEVLRVR